MNFRKSLIAGAALFASVGVALATGLWWGLPIIDGASYCASTTNNTCTSTIPAGPALTGNELVPVDTMASGGAAVPQTAYLSVMTLGAGVLDFQVPLTGATITETAQMNQLIIDPAGTLATLTVQLPAATGLLNGQVWGMCTTQVITALTLTAGSGTTVKNAPTAMLVPVATGAASCFAYRYVKAQTAWYRIQ